jgi:flagellar protein FlgJ
MSAPLSGGAAPAGHVAAANPRPLPIGAAKTPADPREKLRALSGQLEAVFINQLFQAMRATVPEDGPTEAAAGQEMFTSMLDDRLAGEAAQRMQHGIGEALYRQLSRGLPAGSAVNPNHGDQP